MNLNYLYTPILTPVDPPVDTTIQDLPLEKLSWEDFEKLCLAIVQIDFSINDCEIYGIKGQAQEGIDIYGRQPNGKYSSYQCKRYQDFELNDINKAVEYFKKKDFFDKSDKLHLCTSCEWNRKEVQNRFEVLKTELEKDNIILVKLDKVQLSRHLKNQPQIVYDFFGLEWVRKFNGELALQQLSKAKRLDAKQIAKFRTELYEFYSAIFNIQDPGIPTKELNSLYTLQERFIVPDILSHMKDEDFETTKADLPATLNENQDRYYYDDYWYSQSENEYRYRGLHNRNNVEEDSSIDVRIKIDDALEADNKNIIIGDPGAGKSTLLRYIVLDILSPTSQLENISQKYGRTLPVWLPFAFITKHLSEDDALSISEILKLWFSSNGKAHLFEIVKDALDDERLFLVVDGIDEWNSISSAQQAITRIETIRVLNNCKVLYSSRPYGFKLLKDFFTNLTVLNLAGFSKVQQRAFVEKWYSKWVLIQTNNGNHSFSEFQTDSFIKELEQTGDLKKLAEIPLLLSILVLQKMQNAVLPKNKLEALKEITQYLIKKHPGKRVADAGIVQESTVDVDFKDIFCEVAIYIQRESNDGVILKTEAQKVVEEYLVRYAEYDKAKAKIRSEELLEVTANNFGIIIEKSNNEISFGHKQFQEFLAAQQLYESDEDLANEFIKQYAANPVFHQVIISFFGLMQLKQVKRYTKHFNALKDAVREPYQEDYLKLISYEIAVNLENTPSGIMASSFDSIVYDFEHETDPTYKEALLRRILSVLHNGRLRERAQHFLLQYFPSQYKYSDDRIKALRYVKELNDAQFQFLKKALINGSIQMRHDASYAFKTHIKSENVFNFIKDLILSCSNPDILAFGINSIITNELEEKVIDSIIGSVETDAPIVKLFLFKYKVFAKRHSPDDLNAVLSVINQMPYQLKQESILLLIDAFSDNNYLRDRLIESVDKKGLKRDGEDAIDGHIAWDVLFHSFNKDNLVVSLIKSQFEEEEYPFIRSDRLETFQHLSYYFKTNCELIPVIENWLDQRLKKYSHVDNEVAFACIIIRSEKVKNILLDDLPNSGISHWNVMALLEGWPNDTDVKAKLKEYFRTIETQKTSASAHFVSKIFDDSEKGEAIKILEDIIFDERITFRERALISLIEIDKEYFEANILKRLIGELDSFSKGMFAQYYTALDTVIRNFYSNLEVQTYCLERVENDSHLYSLCVQYFPEKIETEERLLKKSVALPRELRSLVLESFADLSILPNAVEKVLSDFQTEAEEEVMSDMAMCLFNHIKETHASKISELSKPLIFARGHDYEVKRNIAFVGFLISKNLSEYFSIEDGEYRNAGTSRRLDIFSEFDYRKSSSGMMIKAIIENFEYLISITGEDFSSIIEHIQSSKNVEDIWGFFARHSVASSPTYSYLMKFVLNNSTTITNKSIISFLNRTTPKSSILKDILLEIVKNTGRKNEILAGRILGTNFKNDIQVYTEMCNVQNVYDNGRIIALCNGWPQEPLLKKIFDELVQNPYDIDHYVGFNLKFLFRDVDNLVQFLKHTTANTNNIKQYHKYFFVPMLERLKRDKEFGFAIKGLLLSSSRMSEKISYYNLLSQANMIDEDVISWKSKIVQFKNDFGYDIVSNRTVRMKDILHYYY